MTTKVPSRQITSGSATNGQVLTADGLGGASFKGTPYFSQEVAISAGSVVSVPHGLTSIKGATVYLKCTSADMGYAVGDKVPLQISTDTGTLSGVYGGATGFNNTSVFTRISTSGIALLNLSTGAYNTINVSKWVFLFTAW